MHHLAHALVTAAAFLEFAEDDTINPDDAVRALEDITSALQGATPDEIEALRQICEMERAVHADRGANHDVLQFFDNFLYNFGLRETTSD